MMHAVTAITEDLRGAIKALEPPFLALPENGHTAETLAYRRGVRDAYQAVLNEIEKLT